MEKPAAEGTFVVSGYRWVVVLSYVVSQLASGAVYGVFIPFSNYMQDIYGIPHVAIVLTCFTFNGVYPFSSFFFADWFILRFGLYISVSLALILR